MNDRPNADMSEYWNGDGGKKWVDYQGKMEEGLKPFADAAIAAAALSPDEFVIDIGCGCGDTSFEIARRVGPKGHVHGLDISKPMLERAKERSVGVKNTSFECGDAQTYSFKKDAFDIMLSRFGVMFFDDPANAFGNIRQSLKSGGRVAFICWRPVKDNEWVSLPLDVLANHLTLPAPPKPNDPGPFSFSDPERVSRILTSAGFVDISIEKTDIPFKIGGNIDEGVQFLMELGPASKAIAETEPDETTKSHIADELRNVIKPFETEQGVAMNAATWIVTARNP